LIHQLIHPEKSLDILHSKMELQLLETKTEIHVKILNTNDLSNRYTSCRISYPAKMCDDAILSVLYYLHKMFLTLYSISTQSSQNENLYFELID
jgi:hypothetical protein